MIELIEGARQANRELREALRKLDLSAAGHALEKLESVLGNVQHTPNSEIEAVERMLADLHTSACNTRAWVLQLNMLEVRTAMAVENLNRIVGVIEACRSAVKEREQEATREAVAVQRASDELGQALAERTELELRLKRQQKTIQEVHEHLERVTKGSRPVVERAAIVVSELEQLRLAIITALFKGPNGQLLADVDSSAITAEAVEMWAPRLQRLLSGSGVAEALIEDLQPAWGVSK